MDDGNVTSGNDFDPANIREEEFELHTTFIVPDLPVEPGTPNRAEATLPRNLVLKSSQALSDVSITIYFNLVKLSTRSNNWKNDYSSFWTYFFTMWHLVCLL